MKDANTPAASVIDVLEQRVEAHPDKLACCFVGTDGTELERHSYASFLARVRAISADLVARSDILPEARVLLVFPSGAEMVAAYFACAHAGLVAVPVAPLTAPDRHAALARIARVAKDCDASAVLCGRACKALLDSTGADDGGQYLAVAAALPWIVAEDIPDSPQIVAPRTPAKLLMLQYTSGSTNRPKGVKVSHANILANRAMFVDHPDPVAVTWLPQHHDMGLIGGYIYPLLSGGTSYGMAPSSFIQRPALWLQMMSRYRATAASAPNFAYDFCADPRRVPDDILDDLDLSSLHFLTMAAEPVRPETYRRFLARFERTGLDAQRLVAAYGLAENTLVVTNYGRGAVSFDKRALANGQARRVEHTHQITGATRVMCCGETLPGNELRIVNPDDHTEKPAREVGEIWVRGPCTSEGYWNNPEETAASFGARMANGETGFLRTGDLGFLYDGDLFVSGRIKDLIIVRGQNYFPQDIESAAEEAFLGLRKGGSAAVSLQGDDRASVVALVAELRRHGKSIDPRAVLRAVRDRIGIELDRVVFVPPRSIPKTTSGKIMHFEVARRLEADAFEVLGEHQTNRQGTATAQSLIEEIQTRYQLRGDEDCTLLDAGVDSLDLVVLMHEIRDQISQQGWGRIADQIDVSMVQRVTIRDLFRLFEMFRADPGTQVLELPRLLAGIRDERVEVEAAQMRADIELFAELPALPKGAPAKDGAVFLTGATGFLGPHLLDQLLRQANRPVIALVRGATVAEATERLAKDAETHGLTATATAIREGARVSVVCGDLCERRFGIGAAQWAALCEQVGTILHNGAVVNYLQTYEKMRDTNVLGTLEALRLSREGRPKQVIHISTILIFGWRVLEAALESDRNADMTGVDFGYSQSKWVAEQIVHRAADEGQDVRIFRPAFLSPTVEGQGFGLDITLRLFTFMLKHGIGVDAPNEISILPVDVAARNICAVGLGDDVSTRCFHVTRRDHAQMNDLMAAMAAQTGRKFELFKANDFIPEVIGRCTREDPLFPLVDFFIHYIDRIVATEHKRYDSRLFQAAVSSNKAGQEEPGFDDTVAGMLRYLRRQNQI